MVECRKCQRSFEPTPHQLQKHDYQCLECRRKYELGWRNKRRTLGLKTGGSKTWNPAKAKAWKAAYYSNPEIKMRKCAYMRKYRNDPTLRIKHMARWIVNRQVQSGRIERLPCAICGKAQSQAHHLDYSQPLLIVWLCRDCHRQEHAKAEGR